MRKLLPSGQVGSPRTQPSREQNRNSIDLSSRFSPTKHVRSGSRETKPQNSDTPIRTINQLGLATGEIDTLDTPDRSLSSKSQLPRRMNTKVASASSTSLGRRVRKGQKYEELQLDANQQPSLNHIDSPFQLQEYLSLLIQHDPHDVETIVRLPQASVASTDAFDGDVKGKGKEAEPENVFMGNGAEEEAHLVDTDVWVYEQLRKIVSDFTTPWLTELQRECDRKQKPTTCDAMNAKDWMYLCASHGEEKQCCAIDYVIHTLDGTTALLNSHRHFPSRTYIPTTSLRHFGSVSRRLSRIFVHAYEHHRDTFEECEAETSLYARFVALVKAYDLISVDSLPRLGEKEEGRDFVDKRTVSNDLDLPRSVIESANDFVGRTDASPLHRRLFDSGTELNDGVPTDEVGDDANDMGFDEDVPREEDDSVSLRRSDSNSSRVTAVHVAKGEEE